MLQLALALVMLAATSLLTRRAAELAMMEFGFDPRAVVAAGRAATDLEVVRAIMNEAVQSRFVGLDDLNDEVRRAGRDQVADERQPNFR